LKQNYLKDTQKIVLVGFVLFVVVLAIISSTLNLLKTDAEEAHKEIANIYNKTFSEHFNNSIYNIELFINSLKVLYSEDNIDEKKIDEYVNRYLKENLYIRSINILEEKTIIKSTNKLNLNVKVNTDEYNPKPLFGKNILQFGNTYNGRDFNDAKEINNKKEYSYKQGSFLPLSKLIHLKNKDFTILIALNAEEFLNKYNNDLKEKIGFVEIINLKGEVLISNDKAIKIGEKLIDDKILEILKEKNTYLGIKEFKLLNKSIISVENIKNYPLSLLLRFNYDKSLQNWEEKRFNFLFIITILLIFIVVLILIFVIKNDLNKQKEINFHKLQIENQKRFKMLFEQSNLFSFILDETGKINKINNVALSFLGKDKSDFIDMYIWDLYCFSVDGKIWLQNIIINYFEGNKIEKELSLTNLNSEKKEIEIIINSIFIDGSREFVLFGKDVTEKKLREKELRQAYQVFKNTHDGIVITDEKANIVNVNTAFVKCTGYEVLEAINQNPRFLKSEKNTDDFYKSMWKELKENNYWDGEIINKKKDGTLYTEWLTISAVYNNKNVLTNYIGIFSDISKQKHQEEVIKEKERMLFQQSKMASMGEMIGNIAHQWRQPLSLISVAAGAIKLSQEYKGTYTEEEVSEFVDSITNSTNYLSETIDDFRNFFRQDTKYTSFDCLSAINATLKLLASNFKNKDIEIVFNKTESNYIFASENEFKQVLMNILNNAKDVLVEKNIDNKKYIFIDVYFDKKYIFIDLLDNAGGVDENIIEKVFEPYFTTKHQSIGTGIGLYMAEEIITKHMNGEISVSNKNYIYDGIEYPCANFSLKLPIYKDIKN
jgi:PAS domain S-box-containing protein